MMLEAKGVSKVYFNGVKELRVLNDVHLRVEKQEIVSIVGPSGAGKSTLLHILGALDEPTEGDVFLEDVCLSALNDSQKARIRNTRFGFVFQFYHLLREFTAQENVMMPALIKRQSAQKKDLAGQAAAWLEFLGLGQRVKHRPSQLSGGEQQRVAIARALMNSPEVLFCDEPTGNLDYQTGQQVKDMLWRLNQEKKMTLVIATHSQELAGGSHRVLRIFDGKLTPSLTLPRSGGGKGGGEKWGTIC